MALRFKAKLIRSNTPNVNGVYTTRESMEELRELGELMRPVYHYPLDLTSNGNDNILATRANFKVDISSCVGYMTCYVVDDGDELALVGEFVISNPDIDHTRFQCVVASLRYGGRDNNEVCIQDVTFCVLESSNDYYIKVLNKYGGDTFLRRNMELRKEYGLYSPYGIVYTN